MAYQSDQRLSELAAFSAVVEHGGFSAAARAEGLRKATLSERVRALEERLDAKLLVRSTRTLRLTDEGEAFAARARIALAAVSDAEAAATEMGSRAVGVLRISVPPPLAATLLDGVIAPYLAEHPLVSVEIDASTRTVDLIRDRYDLAVRVGRLPDSALSVRRLGYAAGGYYASRAYLARRGVPARPEDLLEHDTIGIPRGERLPQWRFASGRRHRAVVVRPRVQPWTPPAFEVNALFVAGTSAPKTRLMVDAMAAWFSARGGRL